MVLEDFKETIARAEHISESEILKESQTLAGKNASGVIGALKVLPRALKNIAWLELPSGLGYYPYYLWFLNASPKSYPAPWSHFLSCLA